MAANHVRDHHRVDSEGHRIMILSNPPNGHSIMVADKGVLNVWLTLAIFFWPSSNPRPCYYGHKIDSDGHNSDGHRQRCLNV